ncbi:Hypothetical predicted protein [Mytilus galloprovincialis]|uniref:Uncharacterized protein n=1 Tax=Mytilus galloprovincialis TaxID=29158 RepID=A0A8B6EQX5_MYTGA|nr:Hypothetical predicted protein [Mytilus galloprovincialis]
MQTCLHHGTSLSAAYHYERKNCRREVTDWQSSNVQKAKTVHIQPNKDIVLQGYMDHEIPYHPVCCLLQPTKRAAIPTDLDIAPSLVSYSYKDNRLVPVHISNVTTRTITVSPNAILCEVQPVAVTDIETPDTNNHDVLYDDCSERPTLPACVLNP